MRKHTSKLNQAMKISIVSILVNTGLSLIKLFAGILGHSQAMIADAVHSASDVFSTLIVIAALFVSGKEADDSHEYGHEKFESLASLLLAAALAVTGYEIGLSAVKEIISGSYLTSAAPSMMAAAAAVLSIVVKELMYQVTARIGRREKSEALIADAWHHRSDALSSIGSLAGILCARAGFPIMDPVAGIIISVFILKTAVDILSGAVKKLTDASCDADIENAMKADVLQIPGVLGVDLLKTRQFGSGYYADLEISADGTLSLNEAHGIAGNVHDFLEEKYPDIRHCMVHVNPVNKE